MNRFIITAGGTKERIDAVRAITNDATGRLGSLIAEEFSRRLMNKPHTIYYLCGIGSVIPNIEDANLHIIRIGGTEQLLDEMKYLLITQKIDAVIHSMAVSDYKVNSVASLELLANEIYQRVQDCSNSITCKEWQNILALSANSVSLKDQQKISSDIEHPFMILEKTPKIIGMIKETSPRTRLVGFKLLSGVSRETLHETAYKLLLKNQCEYVLANDTDTIKDGLHIGYLIDKSGNYKEFINKEHIAAGIADSLLDKEEDKK